MANQPVTRTIDPGITMFTAAEIRVAVVPVGTVAKEQMDEYLEKINKYRHVPLDTAKSFYRETQKSPFQHLPWATGCMHFRFLTEEDAKRRTRMVELHAQRQVLAVIAVGVGANCPDIQATYLEYQRICRQFPEAMTQRCLLLEATEEQEAGVQEGWGDLFLLPPGEHLLASHLETCMLDMSMAILTEVEKWLLNASPSMMKLNTYIDSAEFTGQLAVLDDLQKLRLQVTDEEMKEKKKWGRLQKAKGDMCLLGGSPRDAANNYKSAMDLAKTTSDFVWYAAAVEGTTHARIMEALALSSVFTEGEEGSRSGQASPDLCPAQRNDALISKMSSAGFGDRVMWRVLKEAALEEEVRDMLAEARVWYRKRGGGMPLQVEQQLKAVRLLAGLKGMAARKEAVEAATWIMEQLPSLHLHEDRLIAVGEAAQVLGLVGAARKRSLLLWHAAELCRGTDKAEHHALRIAIKALEPPDDPFQQDPDDVPKQHWTLRRDACVVRSWQAVHSAALHSALAAARQASAHAEAWEAAATLLREHHASLDSTEQKSLLEAMSSAAASFTPKSRVRPGQGPGPLVQMNRVLPAPPALQPVEMPFDASALGAASHGPFIFKPPSVKRPSGPVEAVIPNWVCGDEAKVEVYLSNPLAHPLPLERLWLHVRPLAPAGPTPGPEPYPQPGPHGACHSVPVQVTLPPHGKTVRVTLSVSPQQPGQLQILGCKAVVWGVQWSQPFCTFLRRVGGGAMASPQAVQPTIVTVLPPLPLLQATIQGPDLHAIYPPPDDLPSPSPPSHSPASSPSPAPAAAAPPPTPRPSPIHLYEGQVLDLTLTLTNTSQQLLGGMAITTGPSKGPPFKPLPLGLPPTHMQGAHLQADEAPLQALPLHPQQSICLPLRLTVGKAPPTSFEDLVLEARISYMGTLTAASAAAAAAVAADRINPPPAPTAAEAAAAAEAEDADGYEPPLPPQQVGRRLSVPLQLVIHPSLQAHELHCVEQHLPLQDGRRGPLRPAVAPRSGGDAATDRALGKRSPRPQDSGSGSGSGMEGEVAGPLPCSSSAALEPYCLLQLEVRNCSDRYFRTWIAPLADGPPSLQGSSPVQVAEPSTSTLLQWPLLSPTHPSTVPPLPSLPSGTSLPLTLSSSLQSRPPSQIPSDLTRCADAIAATWGLHWQMITAATPAASTPPTGMLRLLPSDLLPGITALAAAISRPSPIHLTCAAVAVLGSPPPTLHNLSAAARQLPPSCGLRGGDQVWGLRAACGDTLELEVRGGSSAEAGVRVTASMGASSMETEGAADGPEGLGPPGALAAGVAFMGASSSFQCSLPAGGHFAHRLAALLVRPGLYRLYLRDVRVEADNEAAFATSSGRLSDTPSIATDPLYILCTA